MRLPPLVRMYWPIFGIRSTCDWTCRLNSTSTFSRSARIGSKSCARASEFSTVLTGRTLSRPEQRVEIGRGLAGHCPGFNFVDARQRVDDPRHVGGLVALAAMRDRGEKGAVGFDQEAPNRHSADPVSKLAGPWKRHDA